MRWGRKPCDMKKETTCQTNGQRYICASFRCKSEISEVVAHSPPVPPYNPKTTATINQTLPKTTTNPKSSRFLFQSGSFLLFSLHQNIKTQPPEPRHQPLQPPTQSPTPQDKAPAPGADTEYTSSQDFRPTVGDVLVPTEPPPPTTTVALTTVILTTTTPRPTPGPREQPRRLEIFNVRDEEELQGETLGQDLDRESEEADNNLRTSHDSQAITQSLFDRSRTEPPRSSRPFVGRPLRPVRPELPVRSRGPSRQRPRPASASRARAPVVAPARKVTPRPVQPPPAPTRTVAQVQDQEGEFEYEYYYDYLEEDNNSRPNPDYDLVPLANKVRILSDGLPHCLDVGVFPHPFSCKKFINCFRNPGTGIQGSIYQCPSYLAFDPVGGRCNWVNEIVCAAGTRA